MGPDVYLQPPLASVGRVPSRSGGHKEAGDEWTARTMGDRRNCHRHRRGTYRDDIGFVDLVDPLPVVVVLSTGTMDSGETRVERR
mgnify:CR=1 FL=1